MCITVCEVHRLTATLKKQRGGKNERTKMKQEVREITERCEIFLM